MIRRILEIFAGRARSRSRAECRKTSRSALFLSEPSAGSFGNQSETVNDRSDAALDNPDSAPNARDRLIATGNGTGDDLSASL